MTHRPILPTIRELTPDDCIALLRQNYLGRVAFMSGDVPAILPVNFVFADGLIVFRTDPGEKLAEIPMRRVAFEIDNIDEKQQAGWSVLVLGSAERVTQQYTLSTLWKEGPVPWASGTRNLFIAITPESITGRAVRALSPD